MRGTKQVWRPFGHALWQCQVNNNLKMEKDDCYIIFFRLQRHNIGCTPPTCLILLLTGKKYMYMWSNAHFFCLHYAEGVYPRSALFCLHRIKGFCNLPFKHSSNNNAILFSCCSRMKWYVMKGRFKFAAMAVMEKNLFPTMITWHM